MKSRKVFIAVLFMLFTSLCFAQLNGRVVGEVMSKEEGERRFGTVTQEVEMNTSVLTGLLSKIDKYIMFNIVNGKLVVLNDSRKVLYPSGASVSANDKFHLYSKSKVEELLRSGSLAETFFQLRSDVFTVTNGNTLLEMACICPPYCPDGGKGDD